MKKTILITFITTALIAVVILIIAPKEVELTKNRMTPHVPYNVSAEAKTLHQQLIIMDWHADSLLWNRDLLKRSDFGHVDIPRLQEGNVAIQMFTVVTKSPSGQNYSSNTGDSDNITALAVIQRWPISTWKSLFSRAVYQAHKLHKFAERSPESLQVILTRSDLEEAVAEHPKSNKVFGLIGLEGVHALEGNIDNVQELYDVGYRMIGLHHFFDNKLGGSLHGQNASGLTPFGKKVVRELDRLQIIIDVSHSHPNVVDDVLNITTRPVVVSHTGIQSYHDSPRNLSDAQMKRIADKGGLIAIGYWQGAIGSIEPISVVKAIKAAIRVVGVDHVALGSDYDGATETSFDTSELAILTQLMLKEGLTPTDIEKVMGGNSVMFLLKYLPDK